MNNSFENSSKNEISKGMDDNTKFIYEVNIPIKPNKFQKWVKEIKKRYKLSLIFDLADLAISLAFCSLVIISNYNPHIFHMNSTFFLFSFCSVIYFFINYVFKIISDSIDNKSEFIFYNIFEIITIAPYIVIRLVNGLNENLTSDLHKISSVLVTYRIFRVEYLVKYFVNFI